MKRSYVLILYFSYFWSISFHVMSFLCRYWVHAKIGQPSERWWCFYVICSYLLRILCVCVLLVLSSLYV